MRPRNANTFTSAYDTFFQFWDNRASKVQAKCKLSASQL